MAVNGLSAPAPDAKDSNALEYEPRYVAMSKTGELSRRAGMIEDGIRRCNLCPRACGADRSSGKTGYCGTDHRLKVAAINLHPWEEPPISGTGGSGTIFFSGCTLRCIFCQNYPISQMGVGREMSADELASEMLRLQKKGAHNINLVTSTHQMAGVARALDIAVKEGLRIPLVYNSSGYESLDTLAVLDGIIDIYLPDIKYSDAAAALKLSGAGDYIRYNRPALLEMWRQVGPIRVDSFGIAQKGMIVRHMVLPEDLSGTSDCLEFLAREIGPDVWVSLMNQYFPAHKGPETPPLNRKISEEEYEAACAVLSNFGLVNGFVQEC